MSPLKTPKAILEVRAWKRAASSTIREYGIEEALRRGTEARDNAREKNRARALLHAKK